MVIIVYALRFIHYEYNATGSSVKPQSLIVFMLWVNLLLVDCRFDFGLSVPSLSEDRYEVLNYDSTVTGLK